MLGPFATASCFTLPFTRCRYCRTPPLSHATCASMSMTTTTTTTTRDRGDHYGPIEWAQSNSQSNSGPLLSVTSRYTVKMSVYPRIFCGEFFRILTQPVPYTHVSVNLRNNEVHVGPTVARHLRIDVHDNDDNNDNA